PHSPYKKSKSFISGKPELWVDCLWGSSSVRTKNGGNAGGRLATEQASSHPPRSCRPAHQSRAGVQAMSTVVCPGSHSGSRPAPFSQFGAPWLLTPSLGKPACENLDVVAARIGLITWALAEHTPCTSRGASARPPAAPGFARLHREPRVLLFRIPQEMEQLAAVERGLDGAREQAQARLGVGVCVAMER